MKSWVPNRNQFDNLVPVMERFALTAVLIIVAIVLLYIAVKWWARRKLQELLHTARLRVDELYPLMSTRTAPLIVDARSSSARKLEPKRIPGAWHVPDDRLNKPLKDIARDRELIVYGSGPNPASVVQVAKLLLHQGFVRVRPLEGGLEAWLAAGYPIEPLRAEEPQSREGKSTAAPERRN